MANIDGLTKQLFNVCYVSYESDNLRHHSLTSITRSPYSQFIPKQISFSFDQAKFNENYHNLHTWI